MGKMQNTTTILAMLRNKYYSVLPQGFERRNVNQPSIDCDYWVKGRFTEEQLLATIDMVHREQPMVTS